LVLCGIFGLFAVEGADLPVPGLRSVVDRSFRLSESRGKEASGIVVNTGAAMLVLKEPVSSSRLIRSREYRTLFGDALRKLAYQGDRYISRVAVYGHSRLVTNGQSELNANNQPVVKDGAVAVHNGIIVNDAELWEKYPGLKQRYNVDTEVFLSLIQMFRAGGQSIVDAARSVYGEIVGAASMAIMFDDEPRGLIATNTGSLYWCQNRSGRILVFASEKFILKELLSDGFLKEDFDAGSIAQLKAGTGCLIDLDTLEKRFFRLEQ